jgi:predicted HicB family RNase H-like nuclease
MFKLKKEATEYENKSLRLPKDLIDKVQALANKNNLSFNKVVIQCIEYALDNMEPE